MVISFIKSEQMAQSELNSMTIAVTLLRLLATGFITQMNLILQILTEIKVDGTGRMKLGDDGSYLSNVVGDWIYYCNRFGWW